MPLLIVRTEKSMPSSLCGGCDTFGFPESDAARQDRRGRPVEIGDPSWERKGPPKPLPGPAIDRDSGGGAAVVRLLVGAIGSKGIRRRSLTDAFV